MAPPRNARGRRASRAGVSLGVVGLFAALVAGSLCATPVAAQSVKRLTPRTSQTTLPLQVATASLPAGEFDVAYSTSLGASGGVPPYAWSIASGPIPLGLVLSSLGTLAGRPGATGTVSVALKVTDSTGASATRTLAFSVTLPPPPPEQLVTASADGLITLTVAGSPPSLLPAGALGSPVPTGISDAVADPAGDGVWVLAGNGRVTTVGSAPNYGEPPTDAPARMVGLAPDAAGTGYWIVSRRGHVYGFGSARGQGSAPPGSLDGPVVGIAAMPHGLGYWLVSGTGVVEAFGDAVEYGSVVGRQLRGHVVGIAPDPAGTGYWLASSTGHVYSFGSARVSRLVPSVPPATPVSAIAPAPSGDGYWLVGASGGVTGYGSAAQIASLAPLLAGSGIVAASSSR